MEKLIKDIIDFQMGHFEVAAFYIGLVVVVSVLGQILVKRLMGVETIASCHEVGSYYMAIVGSLYAVVLGLVVFDAMNNFQEASLAVKDEAKALLAVYSLADQFPGNGKEALKSLTADYVNEVVDKEWSQMDHNEFSVRARLLMWKMLDCVKQINPVSDNQRVVLPILINEALAAWSARRARIEKIGLGIPELEWFSLLAGAVVMILFTYFFTIAIGIVQLVMTGMLAFMIAINLYLVLSFGNPYSGDLRIPATAFSVLNQYMNSHLSLMDGGEVMVPVQ